MADDYGAPPIFVGHFPISLAEVMYYLYLPVGISSISAKIRLPYNVEACRPLIDRAIDRAGRSYKFVYLSARKGWATPDNPLNRPGYHCDGFGTDDVNFVWWSGPGTRFAIQPFKDISDDHLVSMRQFEEQVDLRNVVTSLEHGLYRIGPKVVHATPVIGHPGCMRQYVKISLSDERYNLENNSHNYLFDYDWPLHSREIVRNNPAATQSDYVKDAP